MEADGPWWCPWSSKPAWGVKSVPGVFDSHTPPPLLENVPRGAKHDPLGADPGLCRVTERELHVMRLRFIPICALLCVAALSSAGCQQIKQAITPPPTIKHVKVAAKVAAPGAAVVGKLKDGAPSDLPLWEGASVLHAKVTKSGAGDSWMATLGTGDAYNAVVGGMATGFQNAGWQVQSQDASSGDASATVFTVAGPNAAGVVTISAQQDKTTHIDYAMTALAK